jgi:hypothetical protein
VTRQQLVGRIGNPSYNSGQQVGRIANPSYNFGWLLLPLLLVVAGLVGAADDPPVGPPDEPPVLLKKKKKADDGAKAQPALEKEKEKEKEKPRIEEEPDEPEIPVEDEQEVLNRIARNLKIAEDRLANRELGEGTRQVQRDIVKDLESLIHQLQQPPQGGEGGGDSSNESKQGGLKGQRQQGGQKMAGGMRPGRNQLTRKSGQGQGQGNQQQQQGMAQNGSGNNGGGGGPPSGEQVNRLGGLNKDIWGHLPESMRREMDVYAREQFMAKYSEMIKQYYATVAKEGREK